jgi:hypothetical protein
VQDNRGNRDYRLFRKLGFDVVECWISVRRPVAVPVGMDRHFDKIGVVEGIGCSLVFGILEVVIGRPQLPQFTTEGPTIGGKASPSAFSMKIPLVPIAVFGIG